MYRGNSQKLLILGCRQARLTAPIGALPTIGGLAEMVAVEGVPVHNGEMFSVGLLDDIY